MDITTNQIETKYSIFKKSPETHPNYSDEWKTFWQRRYNELIAEGKDPNGHNFKPEWIKFWMHRMKQLKLEEIERKKEELRISLNLSEEMAQCFDGEIERKTFERKKSPSSRRSRRSQSPIEISNDLSNKRLKQDPSYSKSLERSQSGKTLKLAHDKTIVQPDPIEIARTLAQSLFDQGKSDVSEDELHEILDNYIRTHHLSTKDDLEKLKGVDEPSTSSFKLNPISSQVKEESENSATGLENLEDDDLEILLRNFSDLTKEEQKHLIRYLEKVEKTNPSRADRLSKYVDAGDDEIDDDETSQLPEKQAVRLSSDSDDDEFNVTPHVLTHSLNRQEAPQLSCDVQLTEEPESEIAFPVQYSSSTTSFDSNQSEYYVDEERGNGGEAPNFNPVEPETILAADEVTIEEINDLLQGPPRDPRWGSDAYIDDYYGSSESLMEESSEPIEDYVPFTSIRASPINSDLEDFYFSFLYHIYAYFQY